MVYEIGDKDGGVKATFIKKTLNSKVSSTVRCGLLPIEAFTLMSYSPKSAS